MTDVSEATCHDTERLSAMGMGLFICRQILQVHRGTIAASPRANSGSEFVISLPAVGQRLAKEN